MPDRVVYFSHGQESGPWGTKITALAKIAKRQGFHVESPDYSFTKNPDERVKHLIGLKPSAKECLVLVGSSMGGYVAAAASRDLKAQGLFLMAPAFFIPEYSEQSPKPQSPVTEIVHGWHDDVVPLDHSLRFAQEYSVDLHILDSDHRLTSAISTIEKLFALFLDRVVAKEGP